MPDSDTSVPKPSLPLSILVVDDDPSVLTLMSRFLGKEGWSILTAQTIQQANEHLATVEPDVMIVDVYLRQEDGLTYVEDLRRRYPRAGIVMISSDDTESLARKALDSGADAFLSKPISPAALLLTMRQLGDLRAERMRRDDLEVELQNSIRSTVFPEIVTNSDAMRAVLRLVQKVGPRDMSVLICGESGTGKELFARAVHQQSTRARGPFVELNCAALPPNLVESELFGHEKGAFTGAVAARTGKLQQAHGGTLFLDEIGELPLEVQPKLLRALQEKRIVPIGGKEMVQCDFRLLSATNRDLVEEVRTGRFREDLFYRIAVFPIKLPNLRDRMEDIDLLLAHFLRQEGIEKPTITPGARELLRTHNWPGNVRELRNFSQAVTLFTEGNAIDSDAVRAYFGSRLELGTSTNTPLPIDGRGRRGVQKLEDLEKREILYALQYYAGNVSEAARALGMGRATLYKYLKRHDIDMGRFGIQPEAEVIPVAGEHAT